MTPGDPLQGPLLQFVSGVVGLKDDLKEGERLAALFRKLREDDFLPGPLTHEALLALAGRSVEPGSLLAEEAVASEERKLHLEVEQFASEFFAIPVSSRIDRWRTLARRCARHPRLIDRVRNLKPGLEIDRQSANDPSPAVGRLLDDLLTLFPLRAEPRAFESRARVERFRSDPSLTPASRGRALKQVLKRHPEVAALSHGYLAQLGQPRRSIQAVRAKARLLSTLHANVEDRPVVYVLLLVSFFGGLIRFATSTRTTSSPSTPPAYTAPSSSFRPTINPTPMPILKSNQQMLRKFIADEIKAKVKSEVTRIGKSIDETQLQEVFDGLPIDELPPVGGMATIVLQGLWTEDLRDRFVDRLKEGLEATDLALSEQELDDLPKRCFPTPTKKRSSGRPKSP